MVNSSIFWNKLNSSRHYVLFYCMMHGNDIFTNPKMVYITCSIATALDCRIIVTDCGMAGALDILLVNTDDVIVL